MGPEMQHITLEPDELAFSMPAWCVTGSIGTSTAVWVLLAESVLCSRRRGQEVGPGCCCAAHL